MRILIIFLLGGICIFAECNRSPFGCFESTWQFQIPMQIYPDNEEVKIGDTIWMQLSSPKHFTDAISGQDIDFSQAANLSTNITFYQFADSGNGIKYLKPAVAFFDYKLVYGRFLPDDRGASYNVDYNFKETDSSYEFKLGIVPKLTGEFVFAPYDVSSVYRKNAKCPQAAFQYAIINTNQHLKTYLDFYPGHVLSSLEKRIVYCFKVK
ncbi:MAG TPA: hypothetical protein VLC98_08475 [Phnomibacter sp.]|nr:hypothetical protein [Phnomibacter sp.]